MPRVQLESPLLPPWEVHFRGGGVDEETYRGVVRLSPRVPHQVVLQHPTRFRFPLQFGEVQVRTVNGEVVKATILTKEWKTQHQGLTTLVWSLTHKHIQVEGEVRIGVGGVAVGDLDPGRHAEMLRLLTTPLLKFPHSLELYLVREDSESTGQVVTHEANRTA